MGGGYQKLNLKGHDSELNSTSQTVQREFGTFMKAHIVNLF